MTPGGWGRTHGPSRHKDKETQQEWPLNLGIFLHQTSGGLGAARGRTDPSHPPGKSAKVELTKSRVSAEFPSAKRTQTPFFPNYTQIGHF